MNWIQANKFLTGFIAVMLVGVGVLGYFMFSASAAYDAADDSYQQKATELNRLRHLPLYPNTKNLNALEAQKKDAAKLVSEFQAQLATKQFKPDDITPQQFQDRLKKAVTEVADAAAAAHMELPQDNKFYLGFNPYETRPPEPEAVGPLTKQLKAIRWVVERFIDAKVSKLSSLTRFPLPEEKSLSAASNTRRTGTARPREDREERDLISTFPFDVGLVARQKSFADALDVIVGPTAQQFYIPRVLRIKNQKPAPPERQAPAGAGTSAPVPGTPAGPVQPAAPLGYIVGEEQIEVSMRLEIVEIAAPKEEHAGAPGVNAQAPK